MALNEFAKLSPSDGEPYDEMGFGYSVGISGNTVIVGAPQRLGNITGSAYLFDATTGAQLAKLVANDSAIGNEFGISVAIEGNLAIVGAAGDDDNGANSGSAYLFDVTTGAQLAKLTASDAAMSDHFGYSVGISGNTAIVGAYQDDDNGTDSGSAYLFDVTTRTQLAKLTASDSEEGDHFGWSVDISDGTAIVSAVSLYRDDQLSIGSAYLFDGATGVQLARLIPSGTPLVFGASIAISGNKSIVGGIDDVDPYLFDTTTGRELARLSSSDRLLEYVVNDASVAISGNIVVVGGIGPEEIYGDDVGQVYLFDVSIPEPCTLLLAAWASIAVPGWRRRQIAD